MLDGVTHTSFRTTSYFNNGGVLLDYYSAQTAQSAGAWHASSVTRASGTALFTVRQSDNEYRSFTTGGSSSGVSAISTSGTGSFMQMHRDISANISSGTPIASGAVMAYAIKPNEPSIGETYVDNPIGDALLPLALMVSIYAVARFFKNRRRTQSINSANSQTL